MEDGGGDGMPFEDEAETATYDKERYPMATLQTRVQHLSPAKQAVLRAMLEKKDIGTAQFLRLTNSNLVPIKPGQPGAPALFVCPATEGSVAYFKHYAPYLPEPWALFGC
jgi:hypothetical protein